MATARRFTDRTEAGEQLAAALLERELDADQPGTCCANCDDYIVNRNGDGFGACAEVEGYIDGADRCASYEEVPEPEVPDELSEEELATAEVPAEYRTASSRAGEKRDPDNLQTQENVRLMESVETVRDDLGPIEDRARESRTPSPQSDLRPDALDPSPSSGLELHEDSLGVGSLIGQDGADFPDDPIAVLLFDLHGHSLDEFVPGGKVR